MDKVFCKFSHVNLQQILVKGGGGYSRRKIFSNIKMKIQDFDLHIDLYLDIDESQSKPYESWYM